MLRYLYYFQALNLARQFAIQINSKDGNFPMKSPMLCCLLISSNTHKTCSIRTSSEFLRIFNGFSKDMGSIRIRYIGGEGKAGEPVGLF